MRRLWEQVKPFHTLNLIPPPLHISLSRLQNPPHIPRLRVHITAHVHNRPTPKLNQLLNELLIAPLPWRVNHQHRLLGRKVADSRKDVGRIARTERDFGRRDAVQ